MAESTTTRLALPRWSAGTDGPDRTEIDGAMANLEAEAAGFLRDALGSRPAAAAAYEGFLFEDTGSAGALYWCDGAAWYGPFYRAVDEDDMVSDSAVLVPTQQSVKAYVDANATSVSFDDESVTTYTLVLADAGLVKRFTAAGAVTVTVPPNSSVAFATGATVEVYAAGAGGVTVAAGSGVTVRNAGALAQYATAVLTKHATDEWVLTGAVS